MNELASTLITGNDTRIQIKRKDDAGLISYYVALNANMVIVSRSELEDLAMAIEQILHCGGRS